MSDADAFIRRRNGEWTSGAGLEWLRNRIRRDAEGSEPPATNEFLVNRPTLLRWVDDACRSHGFSAVWEVGFGSGHFLGLLNATLPSSVQRLIGTDLSDEMVGLAARRFAGTRIDVAQADALSFVEALPESQKTLIVGYGVFECLHPSELQALLRVVARRGDAIALCEPINMDVFTEEESTLRINGLYSHNYPRLFARCDMRLDKLHLNYEGDRLPNYYTLIALAYARTRAS